jgi:sulfite reductase (ferredoxin)
VGHYTPLNGNEQFKKDDDGLNVRTRIETIYSKRGFDSIDPNDLRGRMRWWGLYTQRKPGIDGGKTAILEPEELDDKYFMLRVRIDGGQLTTQQLRVIGEISQEFARAPPTSPTGRTSSTTGSDRGRPGDLGAPRSRRAFHHRGLRRHAPRHPRLARRRDRRGRDHRRHPGDRRDPPPLHRQQGLLEPAPQVQVRDLRLADDVAHEINDIAFVGVNHPEHGPGFDLWVGGGLSTNPKIGQRLGAWVPLDEVPDV